MSDLQSIIDALSSPRVPLAASLPTLPPKPGLYAIWPDRESSADLGLDDLPESIPLYVGKAEDSIVTRDINTHFCVGRTGSSTVRRSFAALLRERLDLRGMPRNPSKPGYFANYGLSSRDDEKLTAWMRSHLQLAIWIADGERKLEDVERDVLRFWQPPINIAGVTHRWRADVRQARKAMADQARAWTPE